MTTSTEIDVALRSSRTRAFHASQSLFLPPTSSPFADRTAEQGRASTPALSPTFSPKAAFSSLQVSDQNRTVPSARTRGRRRIPEHSHDRHSPDRESRANDGAWHIH